jgi:hypothetical protein
MSENNAQEPSPIPKLLLKKPPKARITRTDRDRIMFIIGVVLVIFMLVTGFLATRATVKNTRPIRYKGPVEDPFKVGGLYKPFGEVLFSSAQGSVNPWKG